MISSAKYIAFLRGINVGGHHKVPMLELRKKMESLNFRQVTTILNTGNIIFEGPADDLQILEIMIAQQLEKHFGFPIPTILRKAEMIHKLLHQNPFEAVTLSKDIRLYISFLQQNPKVELTLPWESDDKSYKIIDISDKNILSILDLSISGTPKGMEALEKYFGKEITTRNWNTIKRIGKKLE